MGNKPMPETTTNPVQQTAPSKDVNEKIYEKVSEALVDRQDYEKRLAKFEHQRFGKDRPRTNNDPWPNASNYRRKKSDEIIEQKKAFYSQIIHSSQYIANFKALIPQNLEFANLNEAYYDYIVKEKTEFERAMIYALDKGLQDGTSFVKITWDIDNQIPVFKWIENLMIIVPPKTLHLEDSPWIVHVVQLSEKEAKARYGNLPGFDNFLKGALSTDEDSELINDTVQRERERYERRGINVSGKQSLTLWEYHYSQGGKKRMKTISPDEPSFDFQDDQEYPYVDSDGKQRWMFEHFRREWLSPDIYSSRGVPEIVWEEEFLVTAIERMKHNFMTLTCQPIFTAPNGLPPGSNNNISFIPGSVLPGNLVPLQWPAPPIAWDKETLNVESIVDRRMVTNNAAAGPNTLYTGGDGNKTARQVSFEASLQTLSVNYETTPWKKFLRSVLRQGWQRVAQFKPQSLTFYLNNTLKQLPVEALNGDFNIVLSWSVDNINKEFNLQQAFALWQASIQNPYANPQEAWKNYTDQLAPGQGQRFQANTEELQADAVESIAKELDTMVSTGFPVRPKQNIDHYLAVVTTMQFIQAQQQMGMPIHPQRLPLLQQYMAAHRQLLAKTDPEKYKLLNQQLSELDIAQRQQMAQQAQQQQLQNQIVGAQAQQQAASNQMPAQPQGLPPQQPQTPGMTV